MFVFILSFLVYGASFAWIAMSRSGWFGGVMFGVFASIFFCFWYVPRKINVVSAYCLPTFIFFVGGAFFVLLIDREFIWLCPPCLSLGLALWWRNIYYYYHQKESYRILMIPQTIRWFLPIGFFLSMNGLWASSVFFGLTLSELLIPALVVWCVAFGYWVWFLKFEWRQIYIELLIATIAFIQLTYLLFLLPNTFFVKGSIHALFYLVGTAALRVHQTQQKALYHFVKFTIISIVILGAILGTARWK